MLAARAASASASAWILATVAHARAPCYVCYMARKVALAVAVVVGVMSVGLVATAENGQTPAGLPSALSASDLPKVVVPEGDLAAVETALQRAAPEFGVDADSYKSARVLTTTSAGPLYVIPGSSGLCLVVPTGYVSCGPLGYRDMEATETQAVVLIVRNPAGSAEGGGVVLRDAKGIDIMREGGTPLPLSKVRGGFVLAPGRVDAAEVAGLAVR